MNSRRQILKLLGLAPTAAASGASQLTALMASPGVGAAVAAAEVASAAGAQSGFGILGPILGKQIDKLKRRADDEIWRKRDVRNANFDADIACMRSTSLAYKSRKQLERDYEDVEMQHKIQEMLWGNP